MTSINASPFKPPVLLFRELLGASPNNLQRFFLRSRATHH
jgi:hypothetical protein